MQEAFEKSELQKQPTNVFAAVARSVDAAVTSGDHALAETLLNAIYYLADNSEMAGITPAALVSPKPVINPGL